MNIRSIFVCLFIARLALAAFFVRIAYLMKDEFVIQLLLVLGAIFIAALGGKFMTDTRDKD